MTYFSAFLTNHLELCLSILAAATGLLVWLLILLSSRRLKRHPVRVRLTLRKPHYIQTVLALVCMSTGGCTGMRLGNMRH